MSSDPRILLIQERLENDLTIGESHFREFKSALEGPERNRPRKARLVARDIGETLVAFANADGGTLIVGAEDDGAISGITYAEADLEVLRNAPKTHVHADTPLPGVRTHLVTIKGRPVLVFRVEKGTRYIHLTSDGRCLQRRDTETIPVSSERIHFERHEQLSREYDRQWLDNATMADLRLDLLARVTERVSPGFSPEKCLQSLGLAEYVDGSIRLRKAALLLFSTDVRRWHPRSEIRLQLVHGTELLTGADYNVIKDETHSGNILELLSEGWEQVRQFLVQKRLVGGTFQLQSSYPEDACREALVNAIAHRDYSIEGRAIEILAFSDRMEVRNPGRLLSTVRLSELKRGAGVHDSRNTNIARVLRELGYMQEMGEGIRRVRALMNGHELAPPDIDTIDHSFLMTFSQRNVFSASELRWLDAFGQFNLSREEKLVVLLGRAGKLISTNQIWETLDILDTEEYRRVIELLRTKGLWSTQVTRNAAEVVAQRKGIGPGEVPRFSIRTPDVARRDQEEVAKALISLGLQNRIGNSHYERISERLSAQNYYRNAAGIRQLLHWMELIEPDGVPTEQLRNLWLKEQHTGSNTQVTETQDSGDQASSSFAPVKDIYVGNLDYDATEREILDMFEKAGPVVEVTVPRDYLTGRNRGYAFVRMGDSATSRKALTRLNGQFLRNRPVKLGWSFR